MQEDTEFPKKRSQDPSSVSMAKINSIFRRSIHLFLKNYSSITSAPALLIFPFSAAILLSSSFSPFAPAIHMRLESLFDAAGFPSNSQFFSLLNLKLSQTLSSSIFSLPFGLTFLLIAKACIIQKLSSSPSSQFFPLYLSLLQTHICNSFFILSANAGGLSLLFLSFNCLEALGLASPNQILFLSAAGAVFYSIILANAFVICNLAIVIAGMENSRGFPAILKACKLVQENSQAALTLALPANLGLAAIEALFQFRVAKSYRYEKSDFSAAWEGPLLIYMYSLLVLLDTIVGCTFYKTCKYKRQSNQASRYLLIELVEEDDDDVSLEKIAVLP